MKMTYSDEFQATRFFSVHTNANHPWVELSVRFDVSKQAFNETYLYPTFLKSILEHLAGDQKRIALLYLLHSEQTPVSL